METTIQKWGNSQGIRLQQFLLKEANVQVGDTVSVYVKADSIVIQKKLAKYPTLEELLARIPKDYKPEEYDWGPPVGKEVW